MYVERHGRGPRGFLAFHGWAGDHREFAPLAARLPEDATLFSVDLPGYGSSPPPPRWDLAAVVEEIAALMADEGITGTTLIGFCSGAVIAMMTAQQEPGRVSRMVLIDPFAFVPWYFRLFLAGTFGRRAYRTTFASPLGRRVTNWILQRRQTADADFTAAFARVDHEVTLRYLRLFDAIEGPRLFRDLAMPIDIARGERTFAAVRASVAQLAAVWPHARVIELHHVGHLPLVKGARQLSDIVFRQAASAAVPA